MNTIPPSRSVSRGTHGRGFTMLELQVALVLLAMGMVTFAGLITSHARVMARLQGEFADNATLYVTRLDDPWLRKIGAHAEITTEPYDESLVDSLLELIYGLTPPLEENDVSLVSVQKSLAGRSIHVIVNVEAKESWAKIKAEMEQRVAANPGTPLATQLAVVVGNLGNAITDFNALDYTGAMTDVRTGITNLQNMVTGGVMVDDLLWRQRISTLSRKEATDAIARAEERWGGVGLYPLILTQAALDVTSGDSNHLLTLYRQAVSNYRDAVNKAESY